MPKWFLKSVEISGGFLPGLSIQFPRGLTCIIGPRGSGKSTFADTLRYGIGGISQLPELSNDRTRAALNDLVVRGRLNSGLDVKRRAK